MGPNSMTGILLRRGDWDTHMLRGDPERTERSGPASSQGKMTQKKQTHQYIPASGVVGE